MDDATSITTIPTNQILYWWASMPAEHSQDYQHVVSMARTRGVKTTIDQARRLVQKHLRKRGYLPFGRKPTSDDYLNAKSKYLSDWYEPNTKWLSS